MSTLKVDTIQNVAGSSSSTTSNLVVARCKAWINFNGTGTVAIVGSFNVSSLVDRGTGQYTFNFSTAMPNDNYCAPTMPRGNSRTGGVGEQGDLSTTNIKYQSRDAGGGMTDRDVNGIAVFSD